jgi:hypothetical protein
MLLILADEKKKMENEEKENRHAVGRGGVGAANPIRLKEKKKIILLPDQ